MRLSYRMAWLALLALVLGACGTITGGATIDELETQNAHYQATIDALGTPELTIMALEQYATQNVVLQARLSQAENESLSARATLTVYELGGGGFQPTPGAPAVSVSPNNTPPPVQVTPGSGMVVTPAADSALTQFSQTVTATDLDSQDCPLGVTTIFEPTEDTIYVNTRINYLPAGSQLSARWTANGQLFFDDVECWIPNQDYFDICAFCSIVPDNSMFESGSWTVELLLDGQSMDQIQFQVSGSGDTTQDGQTTSWKTD